MQLDVRGLSCPEPNLRTVSALKDLPQGEVLEVLVETATSRDNITRTVTGKGYAVTVEAMDDGFKLIITAS